MMGAELTRRGGTEMLPGGRPVPSDTGYEDSEAFEIRAELESLVAKGYELERGELNTILRDFSQKACSDTLRSRIAELVERGTPAPTTREQGDD